MSSYSNAPAPPLQRPRPVPKNHKPSGQPGWPRVIVSGEYDSRKSWQAALLSADDRIPNMFWLEIGDGEVTAEEYGAIPGVKYTIIDWDGTWSDMDEQLEAHWWLAKEAEENGTGPIPLTVDAVSGEWAMLKAFGDLRARQKHARNLQAKREDPKRAYDVEYSPIITGDLWGLIDIRHTRWMKWILTWPGPVILIARDKYVTVFEKGEPTKDKVWSLQAKPGLEFVVTSWVRLHQNRNPEILKLKSVRNGVQLDVSKTAQQQADENFSLARLIFDWIGCTAESRAPMYRELQVDEEQSYERINLPESARPAQQNERAAPTGPTPPARTQQELERLTRWVLFLLKAGDVETATDNDTQHVKPKVYASDDVLDLLNADVRERLALDGPAVTAVTFAQLSEAIVHYVSRHKRSPLEPLDVDLDDDPPSTIPPVSEEQGGDLAAAAAAARASRAAVVADSADLPAENDDPDPDSLPEEQVPAEESGLGPMEGELPAGSSIRGREMNADELQAWLAQQSPKTRNILEGIQREGTTDVVVDRRTGDVIDGKEFRTFLREDREMRDEALSH